MTTGHIGILMKMGDGKVLVMTVVDEKTLPIDEPIVKVPINTTKSIYSNMLPSMIVNTSDARPAPELQGLGAAGILREPIWAIKKYDGLFEIKEK